MERAAARAARTLAGEEEARQAAAARRRLRARAAWLLQRQRDADTARWDETHGGAAAGAMVVWRPARSERERGDGGATAQTVGTIRKRRLRREPLAASGAGLNARQRRMTLALASGAPAHVELVARLDQRSGGTLLLVGREVPLCDGEGYRHDTDVT